MGKLPKIEDDYGDIEDYMPAENITSTNEVSDDNFAYRNRIENENKLISILLNNSSKPESVHDVLFNSLDNIEIFKVIEFFHKNEKFFDKEIVKDYLKDTFKNTILANKIEVICTQNKDLNIETFHDYVTFIQKDNTTNKVREIISNISVRVEKGDFSSIRQAAKDLENIEVVKDKREKNMKESMDKAFFLLEQNAEREGSIVGVPTGIPTLDDHISGLNKTDLVILAARPGMGKTATAINFINNANASVGFISSEMPYEQLAYRILALDTGVNAQKFRMPKKLTQSEWESLRIARERLASLPIYINDKASICIQEIEEQAKMWQDKYDIKVLYIDYLQRIHYKGAGFEKMPRHERVGMVAQYSKEIAKRLEIPVVQLAQINRDVEKEGDGRPSLADIKDSGMIEQEADEVIYIYRKPQKDINAITDMELGILKNRHGPLGIVDCKWNPSIMKVYEEEDTSAPF